MSTAHVISLTSDLGCPSASAFTRRDLVFWRQATPLSGEIDYVNSKYGWYGGNHIDDTTDGGRNWKRIGSH
jgi:hypothetical protein